MSDHFRGVVLQMHKVESAIEAGMAERSDYIRFAHIFNADVVIANATQQLYDSLQNKLWSDVKSKDGAYHFELATDLPFYLPTLDQKHEYTLNVCGSEIFVCLRMIRAFFGKGIPQESGLKYFLVHRTHVQNLPEKFKGEGLHPLPIKSFISRRFSCQSSSAGQAVHDNFLKWRSEFISQIAHLIDAMRASCPEAAKYLVPQSSLAFYPIFWLRVKGDDGKAFYQQFLGGFESGTFVPQSNIRTEQMETLNGFLQAQTAIPPDDHALAMARTFCNFGYYDLAIVNLCVACEIALSTKYWSFLKKRGVSNTKLSDNKKDITFSQLLNIHLFAMCDVSGIGDGERTIGQINWARNMRNQIVHDGKSEKEITSDKVMEAIDAADRLLKFLDQEFPA